MKGYNIYQVDKENNFYNGFNMVKYFDTLYNVADFIIRLKKSNGSFAIVIRQGKVLFTSADTLRSLPLFYSLGDSGDLLSSDNGWFLSQVTNSGKIDEISRSEFLLSSYTVGNSTLFDNLEQLQAGQYLYFSSVINEMFHSNATVRA